MDKDLVVKTAISVIISLLVFISGYLVGDVIELRQSVGILTVSTAKNEAKIQRVEDLSTQKSEQLKEAIDRIENKLDMLLNNNIKHNRH